MDLDQARTLLQRINRVFGDLGTGDAAPSALERDLLREYVRRFYEALSEEANRSDRAATPNADGAEPAAAAEGPAGGPVRPVRRPLAGRPLRGSAEASAPFSFEPMPNASPREASPPPPRPPKRMPAPAPPPEVIEVPPSVEEEVRKAEATAAAGASAPTPSPHLEPTPSEPPTPSSLADLPPPLRELFTVERGSDLGDKLASAPVADLTRAMALNERLVAQNQLFGRDAAALREALQRLNGYASFEEAALSLVPTAQAYDWTDEERRPAAQNFVKLVRRRYPA